MQVRKLSELTIEHYVSRKLRGSTIVVSEDTDANGVRELWASFVDFVCAPRGPFQKKSKLGKVEDIVNLAV